ncbi:glycosyltransferase [Crocinitomicaceae bacterium]|nr:glycosyltransferase [Crocinitomicaceae bacterium]
MKLQKINNRFWYSYFRFFLFLYACLIQCIIFIAPFLKKRKKDYDIILYPYSQKGSDGYTRRFEEYLPFLENDKVSYKIQDICSDEEYKKVFKGKKYAYYLFLLKVLRIRIKQVVEIRNAERAFVHRSLYPFYYDQKYPLLEKLASKLCNEVVYDYWDSVWVHHKELNGRIVQIADTISVANDFLHEHYSSLHSNVKYFNIGINLNHYLPKKDYDKKTNDFRLFYTGSPGNVKQMFREIGEYLIEFSILNPIKLILVSSEDQTYKNLNIENYRFDKNTFFKLLNTADVGLYALDDSIATRGKMAMKVLDYAGTGLPILATKYGVSPHLDNKKNVLYCSSKEEWIINLSKLNKDVILRKKLGLNAREMVETFHSVNSSYQEFISLFSRF